MVISIVIPNYNGVDLLRDNLPTLIASLKEAGESYEIIVADDCSSDASVELLQEQYPAIRVVVNERN